MKKKIGIVTLGNYKNYGNRLQNFALFYVLKYKLGYSVQTILNFQNFKDRGILGNLREIKHKKSKYMAEKRRTKKIRGFSRKWTNEYSPTFVKRRYVVDHRKFDKIILGSDQVWNFSWLTEKEAFYFMLGEVPSEKRIGYAISMGNPPIEKKFFNMFSSEIIKFKKLSVREDLARDYFEEKFGVKTETVLDPTMLLSKEEWVDALNLENKVEKGYALTYFLSEPSAKMLKMVEKLKKENGLTVVNLLKNDKESIEYYDYDPKQMIEAIASAKCVLTDSFHASVFSIIFERPFVVDTNRSGGKMSSRIDTLLKSCKLNGRKLQDAYTIDNLFDVSFENCEKNIADLRKKSLFFLQNAIER